MQIAVMRLVPTNRLLSSMASSIPGRRETVDAARADLVATGKANLLAAIRDAGNADFRRSLPLIACRTLVLCGRRDRFNLGAILLIAAAVPNAKLTIVPGLGTSGTSSHLNTSTRPSMAFSETVPTRPESRSGRHAPQHRV
jgi:pimeloyl-ACP methyl ester carboxylesterase